MKMEITNSKSTTENIFHLSHRTESQLFNNYLNDAVKESLQSVIQPAIEGLKDGTYLCKWIRPEYHEIFTIILLEKLLTIKDITDFQVFLSKSPLEDSIKLYLSKIHDMVHSLNDESNKYLKLKVPHVTEEAHIELVKEFNYELLEDTIEELNNISLTKYTPEDFNRLKDERSIYIEYTPENNSWREVNNEFEHSKAMTEAMDNNLHGVPLPEEFAFLKKPVRYNEEMEMYKYQDAPEDDALQLVLAHSLLGDQSDSE
jgi:hypothetical protein